MNRRNIFIVLLLSFALIFCGCDPNLTKDEETVTQIFDFSTEETSIQHDESKEETDSETDSKSGNDEEEQPMESQTDSTATEQPTESQTDSTSESSTESDSFFETSDTDITDSSEEISEETSSDSQTDEITSENTSGEEVESSNEINTETDTESVKEEVTEEVTETDTETDTDTDTETDGDNTGVSCSHEDSDDNGECDICCESVIVYIDFYAINDLHGKFADTSSNCGVDELTTYLKNRADIDDNVILLSSGDMWQGSSESNLTKGMIITEWMNHLGFVSMTLGNHEYDWGSDYIIENAAIAKFPFLAINIYDRQTNSRVEYCTPSVVVECDGIQVGIIGAMGDCYSSISGDKTSDIYFKTGDELTSLVKNEADRLRSSGVDYIVYSIHDGYGSSESNVTNVADDKIDDYYNVMLSSGYIDLVFEGHTHQNYVMFDSNGVYHLQGGGENKGISHVEIKINSVNYHSSVNDAGFVPASEYEKLPDDPIVEELLDKYSDEISKGDEVLGYIASTLESNQIKQLVAELYYKKGLELWDEEYKIVLGGGFITTRTPYKLNAGIIKYCALQSVLPFDNKIVLCSIKGSDLKNRFFETSNDNYYLFYGSYGEEVKKNIVPSETYYIVTDTYTSSYSANNLTVIKTLDSEIFARDLLADYISENSTVKGASVVEIINIADSLEENTATTEKYMVKCIVEEIKNDKYGNMIVSDGKGHEIYVYGVYGKSGELFEALEIKPTVGDTIILFGSLMKYKGATSGTPVLEFYRTTLEEICN